MKYVFKSKYEIEADNDDEAWDVMRDIIDNAETVDDLYVCEVEKNGDEE